MADYEDILSSIVTTTRGGENFTDILGTVDHEIPMPIKPQDDQMNLRNQLNAPLPKKEKNKDGKTRGVRCKTRVKALNPEVIENDCDKMIQEMEAAYLADLENNQMGKPSLNKLQVLEKIMNKIKTPLFAEIFLDKNGLEQFHNFLKRLPDGSWPLSSIRKTILEAVYDLPISVNHLKYTKLGKTITALQECKNESVENKKLATMVKDKWSRIVTGNPMEYSALERCEKENYKLMKKKKRGSARINFAGSVSKGLDDGLGSTSISSKFKMGFNFSIRPSSLLGKREFPIPVTRSSDIDKYLTKIRKVKKGL